MYTWKECIFSFCGCNILKCQYDQVVDSDDKIYMLADLQQSIIEEYWNLHSTDEFDYFFL